MNHSPQMWLLIKEAKALDRLGFTVPEAAVHAALQANRILLMEEILHDMLSEYYSVRPQASFLVAGNGLCSKVNQELTYDRASCEDGHTSGHFSPSPALSMPSWL